MLVGELNVKFDFFFGFLADERVCVWKNLSVFHH